MPIVQVSVWEGMSPENKKKTVEGITKVFEDLGVPKEAVEIARFMKRQRAIGQRVDNCIQKDTRKRVRYEVYKYKVCIQKHQPKRALGCLWNSSGFAKGNYTFWSYVWPVSGEIEIEDNNCTCAISVHVGVPGDISSSTPGVYDGVTNMKDIAYLVSLFNTKPDSSIWNPNADVNNDGVCNMKDIAIAVLHFNQHE